MEEDQEPNQHVCKTCNKSFVSGKALGGHMKRHLFERNSEDCEMGSDPNAVYGLRENPKRSWKLSGSKRKRGFSSKQENVCTDCDKGFSSFRALSCHMRTHSGRKGAEDNICKECGKSFFSMRALFGHMRCHSEKCRVSTDGQSETETFGPIRKKRSQRVRYKITRSQSFSSLYSSSSFSEIEIEREIEEGAICLMMLSRGERDCEIVKSVSTESCGTNPLTFEANEQIAEIEVKSNISDSDETLGKNSGCRVLKSYVADTDLVLLKKEMSGVGDLGIELVSSEKMKAEVKNPVNGCLRRDDSREFENPRMDNESDFEPLDVEPGETFCNAVEIQLAAVDMANDLKADSEVEGADSEVEGADSEVTVSSPRMKARSSAFDPELGATCSSKLKCSADPEVFADQQIEGKYSCKSCMKCFHSHQALGGHRAASRKTCVSVKASSCEKSNQSERVMVDMLGAGSEVPTEQEVGEKTASGCELKQLKWHECSVCFKVFRSGQALGGHKRAHFYEASAQQAAAAFNQEHFDACDALSLNFRNACKEEEADIHNGFRPWWGENSEPHPLLDIISS